MLWECFSSVRTEGTVKVDIWKQIKGNAGREILETGAEVRPPGEQQPYTLYSLQIIFVLLIS